MKDECGFNTPIYGPERNILWANDNRAYLINLQHFMPPEYPISKKANLEKIPSVQSVLYNFLRPSFVAGYSNPLCVQGLTAWILGDPKKDLLNKQLKEATVYLLERTLPELAKELVFFFFFLC